MNNLHYTGKLQNKLSAACVMTCSIMLPTINDIAGNNSDPMYCSIRRFHEGTIMTSHCSYSTTTAFQTAYRTVVRCYATTLQSCKPPAVCRALGSFCISRLQIPSVSKYYRNKECVVFCLQFAIFLPGTVLKTELHRFCL